MAMAYANSLRSSCLKRKVGAVIVDNFGNIFSSGYNEVPADQLPCLHEWGECYRSHLKEKTLEMLNPMIKTNKEEDVKEIISSQYKGLDYCRALHAEENAILNVARFGSSFAIRGGNIFTTTYPCNMCANKIVQVGIEKMTYLEPYPLEEAKNILDNHKVEQEHFEGVLFNGYFRFLKE